MSSVQNFWLHDWIKAQEMIMTKRIKLADLPELDAAPHLDDEVTIAA